PAPLPRARLVSRTQVSQRPGLDLDAIDPQAVALIDRPLRCPLLGGVPGMATIIVDRPGRIRVATSAASRQLLVLAESYHEGWQARCDGQERPVVRVYGDFLGCPVEPGRHLVEFRFRPRSLVLGWRLSALAALLMAAWLVLGLRHRAAASPRRLILLLAGRLWRPDPSSAPSTPRSPGRRLPQERGR
ncbi:MAG: YfhO family protein, partial [Isosphaeraceae bacterium]|nr:YfhO family protein [Isosphaeraceae bacterium]